MRARITAVHEDLQQIEFTCRAGRGGGFVDGPLMPDAISRDVDMEFDVVPQLSEGRNFVYADGVDRKIDLIGDRVMLWLLVEDCDDDGVAYCRLAQDCLILVDTVAGEKLHVGRTIAADLHVSEFKVSISGWPLSR